VNDAVMRVARSLFSQSVTTEHRLLNDQDDTALLPRLDAVYFRHPGAFDGWGSAAFRRRIWMRAQARRVRELVSPQGGRDR
jgi:hypothetical protein